MKVFQFMVLIACALVAMAAALVSASEGRFDGRSLDQTVKDTTTDTGILVTDAGNDITG